MSISKQRKNALAGAPRWILCVFASAIVLLCIGSSRAQQVEPIDAPAANPARPTVATPATLTPVGYLQFENGFVYGTESQEFDTRSSIVQVTKIAVNKRLQALATFEPFVGSRGSNSVVPDETGHRPGEVFAGLQGVVVQGDEKRPTVAVSYIRRLYESPAPEFDIGTNRQSASLLLSADALGFHADINGIVTEQANDAHPRRAQYGQTISISHPVGKLTVSGELWHFTQPLTNGNAVGNLWCAAYPIRRNWVVDAGFNRGLTSTSTRWQGFFGFTYLMPHRLWQHPRLGVFQ